jgi:hypothetical protein
MFSGLVLALFCLASFQAALGVIKPFCPNFKSTSVIHGLEDNEINMTKAWQAAGDATYGTLYSAGCNDCFVEQCKVKEEIVWDPEIDPQMEHFVRAAFSVKYGRLWFANGWTTCSSIVENGYKAVYSEEFVESFVLIQNVKAINCMLKYLLFQGLSNSNVVLSRATTKLPFVEIAIYPMCRDVPPSCEGGSGSSNNIICTNPSSTNACQDAGGKCVTCVCNPDRKAWPPKGPFCGSPFTGYQLSRTYVHLGEQNDLPYLASCPRMYLHPRSEKQPSITEKNSHLSWNAKESKGLCDAMRVSRSLSAPLLPEAPRQTSWFDWLDVDDNKCISLKEFLTRPDSEICLKTNFDCTSAETFKKIAGKTSTDGCGTDISPAEWESFYKPSLPVSPFVAGSDIHPRTHIPEPCANINKKEPFCDQFSVRPASCRSSTASLRPHVSSHMTFNRH